MNWFKFEKALRLLLEYYPKIEQDKPILFHSVRVGTYFYNNWYSEDVQIAWLLHDALEDTNMTKDVIKESFWENVLKIVLANTKTQDLPEEEVEEDIVKKCIKSWEDALIVKMIDVYDNFLFYANENITSEIQKSKKFAKLIKEHKPDSWNDNALSLYDEILEF
jgi:(p)ppGpp synthase/HD superfamily hydrolase